MGILLLAAVLLQDGVKFEAQWHGERSRIVLRETLLITTREDWEWLWRRHAGPKAKAPDVDFAKFRVAAHFAGEQELARVDRFLGAEVKAGSLMLRLDSVADGPNPGGGTCFPYSIVVIPAAPAPVWVGRKGAWREMAPAKRPAGDVQESWRGETAGIDKVEALRITDAKAWGETWKRAYPKWLAPELDFETSMVIALFLPKVAGGLVEAPTARDGETATLVLMDRSGPAMRAPKPAFVFLVLPGSDAKLVVKLGSSAFDHRETVEQAPVEIATLPAIRKYGK